jgi:hypothetical protein
MGLCKILTQVTHLSREKPSYGQQGTEHKMTVVIFDLFSPYYKPNPADIFEPDIVGVPQVFVQSQNDHVQDAAHLSARWCNSFVVSMNTGAGSSETGVLETSRLSPL